MSASPSSRYRLAHKVNQIVSSRGPSFAVSAASWGLGAVLRPLMELVRAIWLHLMAPQVVPIMRINWPTDLFALVGGPDLWRPRQDSNLRPRD